MRIRLAIPDELDDQERKEALNAALESVTIANTGLYRRGKTPKIVGLIKSGAVKWKPEPPGDEHFDLASTVAARGWGDCDDLAPAYAGQLRASGADTAARAFVRRSGPNRWHALVRRGDGTIEDPSRAAGMGASVNGIDPGGSGPAIHRPMTDEPRLCIAIRSSPNRRHWQARVDLPDSSDPWSWTSLAHGLDPRKALVQSIRSARAVVGEEIDDEDDLRLSAISDLVMGADPYEVAQAVYEMADDDVDVMRVILDGVQSVDFLGQTVGSIFDSIAKPFKGVAHSVSKFVAPVMRPISRAYDTVSPYTTVLFPATAAFIDRAKAASTGDPMAFYKSGLMPGTNAGRDVFERNPLGRTAYSAMTPFMSSIPGGAQWMAAAAPRPQGGGAPQGGGGGALPALPPGVDPMDLLAMLLGKGGNAPAREGVERGAVMQPFDSGGPAFMRF